MNNWKEEYLKEQAKKEMKEAKEKEINPLSEYSTSQLKAELRRRKNERQ